MPFAQMVKEKLIKIGDSAFNIKLDFDEKHVLEVNKSYLENTLDVSIKYFISKNIYFFNCTLFFLQLEHFEIKYSDSDEAPENIRNECCPGQPYVTFLPPDASLQLIITNPQPQKPYFQRELPVYDGDNVEKLIKRLKKLDPKLSKCNIEEIPQ